jgi:hypothetical protein
MSGALPGPGGRAYLGVWRYAEMRLRENGSWLIAQVDISPLPSSAGVAVVGVFPPGGSTQPSVPLSTSAGLPVVIPLPARSTARAALEQPAVGALPPGVPPAPIAPEVITRDAAGNATVRAIRLDGPLDLDGRLDEPVYAEVPALTGFIQSLPDEGVGATELTEAWITYDDDNVYVSARIHEEVPEDKWTANEMRRDANQIGNNDNFGLVFDTYYDRRNGYFFYTNPLGAMADIQFVNESSPNFDWNPVWDVRTGRFDGGWTLEVGIPFKSIRYRPGRTQVWGLQLRRAIRRKNEWSHLTPVSRAAAGASGRNGIMRVSSAATLVGLEAPPQGVRIDVKGYGKGSLTTDRRATPTLENELTGDAGGDLKWGVTQNLTADFTYNTDFAQVEVDEQQINLTRFNVLYPEKREFFLESRGIFDFPAGSAGGGRGGGATPAPFFSRRIGLQAGQPIPIIVGGRLTGKVGPIDIGALNIETDEAQALDATGSPVPIAELTNFTAVRLRADVMSRSNVGVLFTRRSQSLVSDGWNHTYGADASFAFFEDLYLAGYYALTQTPGLPTESARLGQSYQAAISYNGDLEGFSVGHLLVEDDFNPEVGFLRRAGFRQTQVSLRRSPRPEMRAIRQITFEVGGDYFENARERYVESRDINGSVGVEFESSDQFRVAYSDIYENLVTPETITGAVIPAGRYDFWGVESSYSFGPQRFFSGTLAGRAGTFYDGHLYSAGFNRGRIEVIPQLSLEPSVSHNWVRLPGQSFNTLLVSTRVNFTFTPRMFFSALAQYNSSIDGISVNARLRWEYSPGSEVFLVYTEERDTFDFERFPVMHNRGLVLKVTRLFRL